MQSWDIGRFLQQALPRELKSLRLVGIVRITSRNTHVWRSRMVPVIPFQEASFAPIVEEFSEEFMVDMLWELESEPATLQLWTVAPIAIPSSMRSWLMNKLQQQNECPNIPLRAFEHSEDRLSLSARIDAEIDADSANEFMSAQPRKTLIEEFAQSFEEASEALFVSWKKGVQIGQDYRELH